MAGTYSLSIDGAGAGHLPPSRCPRCHFAFPLGYCEPSVHDSADAHVSALACDELRSCVPQECWFTHSHASAGNGAQVAPWSSDGCHGSQALLHARSLRGSSKVPTALLPLVRCPSKSPHHHRTSSVGSRIFVNRCRQPRNCPEGFSVHPRPSSRCCWPPTGPP